MRFYMAGQRLSAEVRNYRKEVLPLLRALAVKTSFTRRLQREALPYLQSVFADLNIPRDVDSLTPTLFFPQKLDTQVGDIIGADLTDSRGYFMTELGTCLVFLSNRNLKNVHTFFHEQVHSLGHVLFVTTPYGTSRKIGHFLSKRSENSSAQRGDLLEEMTTDWIAQKASAKLLKDWGFELPEKNPEGYITEKTGGLHYRYYRGVMIYLTENAPELLPLILQSRFDPSLVGELVQWIRFYYGQGAAQQLFRLDSGEIEEIDFVATQLRQDFLR